MLRDSIKKIHKEQTQVLVIQKEKVTEPSGGV